MKVAAIFLSGSDRKPNKAMLIIMYLRKLAIGVDGMRVLGKDRSSNGAAFKDLLSWFSSHQFCDTAYPLT